MTGQGNGTTRWTLAAGALAALLASFLWTPSAFPKLQLCWLRRLTGVSCPGCGLTRAFCAISHGDLPGAWSFHPFGFVFYAGAVTLVVWPFVARGRADLEARVVRSRRVQVSVVVFVFALLAFGFARAWAEVAGH
ncbi:MAG: DUF2752 domain-containing protein [Planctomycetes bacterium]|nr:DUF2752 domain-containing protein [Planctomycetota bacterium]